MTRESFPRGTNLISTDSSSRRRPRPRRRAALPPFRPRPPRRTAPLVYFPRRLIYEKLKRHRDRATAVEKLLITVPFFFVYPHHRIKSVQMALDGKRWEKLTSPVSKTKRRLVDDRDEFSRRRSIELSRIPATSTPLEPFKTGVFGERIIASLA